MKESPTAALVCVCVYVVIVIIAGRRFLNVLIVGGSLRNRYFICL